MVIGIGTYGLSALAGVLSTLSPCVLPLVPLVLASASSAHPKGPWALATGLTLSFATVGLLLATVGVALGISPEVVRSAGAVLLMLFGVLLLSGPLQLRLASALSGVGSLGNNVLNMVNPQGLGGQLFVGLMLGLVWSPCAGPTLGAASTLAAQGHHLSQAALLMLVFGIGASTPLIVLGGLSQKAMMRMRDRMLAVGAMGKRMLGVALLGFGMAIFAGWDKPAEAWLVDHSPVWLTAVTTRF